LRLHGVSPEPLWEGPTVEKLEQPLRISPTLPQPFAPWEDLSVEEYMQESVARWRHFVASRIDDALVTVSDGLLFHGNMTDLMLMGAPVPCLREYVHEVLQVLHPLTPVVVYLRVADVERSVRGITEERGSAWLEYQIRWKLDSPYARERGLRGFPGLVQLYLAYRGVCDELFRLLDVPRCAIDTAGGWDEADRGIRAFLEVPCLSP
jgi:hypothetical protein